MSKVYQKHKKPGMRVMGSSVGDVEIEKLRRRLMEGWVPPAEQRDRCEWCDQPATTRYLGLKACDVHEHLLQWRANADQDNSRRIPSVEKRGGHWEGED